MKFGFPRLEETRLLIQPFETGWRLRSPSTAIGTQESADGGRGREVDFRLGGPLTEQGCRSEIHHHQAHELPRGEVGIVKVEKAGMGKPREPCRDR